MCYSEFSDILGAIAAMDADVLSIETSRSKMELLEDFGEFRYPNEIGPGVYDIHSPRVPTTEEMVDLLRARPEGAPRRAPLGQSRLRSEDARLARGRSGARPNGGGGEDHPHAARWKISLTKTTGCPLKDPLRERPTSWRLDASRSPSIPTPP